MHTPDERMSGETGQVERIQRLVELACVARGWSRQALAAHLGRDVSRLVPEGGNPKLDYVMKLADALAWPVGDVAQTIWEGLPEVADIAAPSAKSHAALLTEGKAAFDRADPSRALEIFKQLAVGAPSASERAMGWANASAAACGLGQYTSCIELATRGLQERGLSLHRRVHLQVNIAHALFHLWQLPMALAMSEIVVQRARPERANTDIRRQLAFALYVRGFAHLRLIDLENDLAQLHADGCASDLTESGQLNEELAESIPDPALRGLANTCRAGLVEADVARGLQTPEQALAAVDAAIDELSSRKEMLNYFLESIAWWAIAGCNIAMRSLQGGTLQRRLAVYTEHALSVAQRINNWAIRERMVAIQYGAHLLVKQQSGVEMAFVLDRDEQAMIASVMGRFPHFRQTGWKILDTSRIIR